MNKLTDEARREWGKNLILLQSTCGNVEVSVDSDDLCDLIESEKAGWEEADKWLAEAIAMPNTRCI
ncbi:hypothetical protein M5X00_29875 [Paenibacillus alvei]|uniref:hypothetical protein n=2 Tax=Paenibacillus alvei TaxID=44250 RepID=UPI000289D14F|nr:hypothetical protein [Paenibacillus alvei]EJW14432.1 hypothetical protein PAV_13c00510 [Paenibacillus alvei DSM 29]MCY9708191.1 hypothetical protein [Paenibacillus alvei]MCY9737900.1 hypothetical protein [Paenibacillus alvei]MCY9758431.1 hypothetical protein [Paenibacillus alvei]MEC0084508.1 hypothetical protein [Paenibacillus alvei]